MQESNINKIASYLRPFITNDDSSPFNYEINLLIDKKSYLDKFVLAEDFPPFEVEIQMSSNCNLKCRWCIGDELQNKRRVEQLPNFIKVNNVDHLVDGIIDFRVNNLGIDTIKFSGFIGEPLIVKKATLKAIRLFSGAGFKVGLFTNGTRMTEDTWKTLSTIDYVHISLDAGPVTFFWLKEKPFAPYTEKTFTKVINNIKGLNESRLQQRNRNLNINVGYVIIPGNHEDIYRTVELVKEAGADSIRFKCDIGGKLNLKNSEFFDRAIEQMESVKQDFHTPNSFSVYTIHTGEDIKNQSYASWNKENGCFFHKFMSTIGSDGEVYLCDHNSMPGANSFGMALNQSFGDIWDSDQRKCVIKDIQFLCKSSVCPPFGNKVNFFLKKIDDLKKEYKKQDVKNALDILRREFITSDI